MVGLQTAGKVKSRSQLEIAVRISLIAMDGTETPSAIASRTSTALASF
jgi:hypothetical protein